MSVKSTTVFLDANVLFSRTLRDWLWMLMTESARQSGLNRIEPRVSEDVLAEMTYRIRRAHPDFADAQVGGIRQMLLKDQPENVVVRGYGAFDVPGLQDRDDLHVLAAAVHGKVDYLVTEDKGFHAVADEFEFETMTADDMLCLIAQRREDLVLRVTRCQLRYWADRSKQCGRDFKPLDEAVRLAQAPKFAEVVKQSVRTLARTGSY